MAGAWHGNFEWITGAWRLSLRFSLKNFTETNVNNSFTNKNNNPPAATSFAQPNGGGQEASHDNLFLLVNGRRPLGVLFIFVSVYAFGSHRRL